jgi:CHAD domain-containing protein
MAFELEHRKHLEDELTKIVRRELRDIARALTTADTRFDDVIHDARKGVKKVRAITTSLEQVGARVPRKDRKRLKSAARSLSRLRDSVATIESLEEMHRRYPAQLPQQTYRTVHRVLMAARNREATRAKRGGLAVDTAEQLLKTRKSAKRWTTPSLDLSDIVEVIATSYRGSRKVMIQARANGQSATLHRWRKKVKTLWYQLRLAKPLAVGAAQLIADMKRLETALGEVHNLVVLAATLRRCGELGSRRGDVRTVVDLAARMRQPLRRRAFALGRRVHSRNGQAFARWLRAATKRGETARRRVRSSLEK